MSLPTNPNQQDIETDSGFQQVDNDPFFLRGLDAIAELTSAEKQRLERARTQYFELGGQSAIAALVPLILLSPLLDLAGFFGFPFYFSAQDSISLPGNDKETPSGRIDLLVIQDRLWIAIVESPWASVTPQAALPSVLKSMRVKAQGDRALFSMITNGQETRFVRLVGTENPQYALSEAYSLSGLGFELYEILRRLKAIARVLSAEGR